MSCDFKAFEYHHIVWWKGLYWKRLYPCSERDWFKKFKFDNLLVDFPIEKLQKENVITDFFKHILRNRIYHDHV